MVPVRLSPEPRSAAEDLATEERNRLGLGDGPSNARARDDRSCGPADTGQGTLGARLRTAREARGLTQAQAAAELWVSRPLLIAMEKGSRGVQPDELITLAGLYGRPVSELLRPAAPPTAIGSGSGRPSHRLSPDGLQLLRQVRHNHARQAPSA